MEEKKQKRRASGTSRQTRGQSRVLTTPAQTYVSSSRDMYGYLAMGFALCMFIYFFGNPTSLKLELLSPSTGLPQQIPPPLSLQPPPNHPILEPARKAQETAKMSNVERTFIAIKPDGVQRGLVGPIISRFESRGFKLVALKLVTPGKAHLEKHYEDLKSKPFFAGLVDYMNSGPICAMVWEGLDAVKTGRVMLGATNPLASAPGTIRGDYCLQMGRNVCHGSDSVESANKEIALWFKDEEVIAWKSAQDAWIYE
ncbi:NDK-domain-containing protein [Trichocladium antarcticum]|uniref:Nucleoside diphosphate kinase n=1 Tax=Trichocladium antarcticum TaxID=1450529 RepID=A0AAN6UQT8_9PEZI|nr:NDK-domain-containing protein [Trichocladium antarcticum]